MYRLHIDLDKRPVYFFLKGIFQGAAQWECTTNFFRRTYVRRVYTPWTEPPVRPWISADMNQNGMDQNIWAKTALLMLPTMPMIEEKLKF